MYNDVPRVKISNDVVATSVLLKARSLRRYALAISTGDVLDQTTPLDKNNRILVDSNLSSSKSLKCLPFNSPFNLGNSAKSHGARSGEYGE